MSESFTIRDYTIQDYPKTKVVLEEGGLFYDLMDSEERMSEKITRDPESILVATVDDQIVGTVSIMEDGRMPFIFRLAVREDHRGKGISLKLMEEAEKRLRDRGYTEVNILVDERDEELKDYYKKQCYEEGNLYRWLYKEIK